MMRNRQYCRLAALLVLAGLTALSAGAQDKMQDKMQSARMGSKADIKFAKGAAQGGIAEVELGKLAASQAGSDSVKQFGQKMVDDHSKANAELIEIASSKSIALPKTMNAKQKSLYTRLKRLHGSAFDAAYVKAMKLDHQHDISEFRKKSSNGQDADVKAFAAKTLPVIEEHARMLGDMGNPGGKMANKMSH